MCLTITAFGEATAAITYWEVNGWERRKQEMQLKGMFNSVTENVKCFPSKQMPSRQGMVFENCCQRQEMKSQQDTILKPRKTPRDSGDGW